MLRHNVLPLRVGTGVAQVHPDYPAGGEHGHLFMPQSSCDFLTARTAVSKLQKTARRAAVCPYMAFHQAPVKTTRHH